VANCGFRPRLQRRARVLLIILRTSLFYRHKDGDHLGRVYSIMGLL